MGSACEVCGGNTTASDDYCPGCGAGRRIPPDELKRRAEAKVTIAQAELAAAQREVDRAEQAAEQADDDRDLEPAGDPEPSSAATSELHTLPKTERARMLSPDDGEDLEGSTLAELEDDDPAGEPVSDALEPVEQGPQDVLEPSSDDAPTLPPGASELASSLASPDD